MEYEKVFPGIYLTLHYDIWTPDKLRQHQFTHIIRIDKHINKIETNLNHHTLKTTTTAAAQEQLQHITSLAENDINFEQENIENLQTLEFETLDLNFGEASHLTTVLPNCYKGVKFIDKALKNRGKVLIVDKIDNEKCITVVVGFLMYKDQLKFR